MKTKCEIYRDSMQNYKKYGIPRAQLIIADVPYNVGNNFYGSNPMWYKGGDNSNGESKLAGKAAKKHGFIHYIPLVFVKNYSPHVLKANMRVVGATEYALVFYRDRLPKFRNGAQQDENGKTIRGTGKMVFNWFPWEKDGKEIPKIHPAQKPVAVLKRLIEVFTDPGDVVIDPCCGSGSTLRAAAELERSAYGFEIDRNFYERAKNEMLVFEKDGQMEITDFPEVLP